MLSDTNYFLFQFAMLVEETEQSEVETDCHQECLPCPWMIWEMTWRPEVLPRATPVTCLAADWEPGRATPAPGDRTWCPTWAGRAARSQARSRTRRGWPAAAPPADSAADGPETEPADTDTNLSNNNHVRVKWAPAAVSAVLVTSPLSSDIQK